MHITKGEERRALTIAFRIRLLCRLGMEVEFDPTSLGLIDGGAVELS